MIMRGRALESGRGPASHQSKSAQNQNVTGWGCEFPARQPNQIL